MKKGGDLLSTLSSKMLKKDKNKFMFGDEFSKLDGKCCYIVTIICTKNRRETTQDS